MMLTESIRPLLSICIPTYNRAALLKSALAALTPQVVALGSKVELLVSDNCSPDGTKEVVECAQRSCPIRYRRNEENFGGLYNFVNTASEFARGDFSWILGDDDLIRPGAVAKIVSIIERFP